MEKVKRLAHKAAFKVREWLRVKGHGITLIVPLHLDDLKGARADNWRWLKKHWKHHLPGAEIIIGEDREAAYNSTPFSKSVAVNNAYRKANGDVIVIIDADVYIEPDSIVYCAKEIRSAIKRGKRLWFMPYRKLFRLTKEVSNRILRSDPKNPFKPSLLPTHYTNHESFKGTPVSRIGHWYGAMIQIMPREAFDEVGGWDTRFKGWGGEDHAAMVAMDTLYYPHKTLPSGILHLWHPVKIATDDPSGKRRLWANQETSNNALSGRYFWSRGFPRRMRRLVDEFRKDLIVREVDIDIDIDIEITEVESCESQ